MPEPGLVDRQALLAWVSTARARSDLPRLIRRLILETTPAGVRVGMPADEGVQSGGWDGTARSPESIRWVPAQTADKPRVNRVCQSVAMGRRRNVR